ncbi:serine protease persephone-like [Battus philenor]|uniref:serine protease persephone-like n=1 Tax=Battus philenor TaxID=42288 RepID=UPI0035CE9880
MMELKLFVLFGTIVYTCLGAGEIGDKCLLTDNESEGMCILITDCQVALNEIRTKNYHKYKRCGFKDLTEIVCCPQKPIDKFGDTERRLGRVADKECKKIVENSIPPLVLHIIGGETAGMGEFPHMVALGYEAPEGYIFQCGGTLLSNLFVISAAHCVDTLDQIKPTIVRMGVVDLGQSTRNNETDVDIKEIITHPQYTRRHKYHDLALLRLDKAVQFSSIVSPACLFTSLKDPDMPLTITGWGRTSNIKNIRNNMLQKAKVTVVSREKCGESYSSWRKLPFGISEEQLCAGDPNGLTDTCQGDSGGPLQGLTGMDGHYRLVGITSFGRGCGSPIPGVYTRIASYLDWIEGVVWPDSTSER